MIEGPDFIVEKKGASEEQAELQQRVLRAFAHYDVAEIATCKEIFLGQYPEDQQGVTILFEMVDVFRDIMTLPGPHDTTKANTEILVSKSQYGITLADYILKNTEHDKFLRTLWGYLRRLARWAQVDEPFESFRNSIVTEIAAYRTLRYSEVNPQFAMPWEDILLGVDLTIRGGTEFVQVKGSGASEKLPFIVSSHDVRSSADIRKVIENSGFLKAGNRRFLADQLYKFTKQGEFLCDGLGREATSYLLVMPYEYCNKTTGVVSMKIADFVRDYFRKH